MFPSKLLEKKRILVGITGGIAAYKACLFIRHLVTAGAEVRAMMTASAEKFITPLTIESLCRYPVYRELFPENQFAATHHIELADWADAAVIIPATANIIGKTANGIGDDFFSTNMLALHCPILFAPAMNSNMWKNAAVQRNIAFLKSDGYFICDPEEGFLAEGYSGVGRLARMEYVLQHLYRAIHPGGQTSLQGKTVMITAGGTREFLDPVRMLTNRSSGKMGFALAWEAFARGANVILVHGQGNITPPVGVKNIPIVSAEDMYQAVAANFVDCDIFISAAAVADYRPDAFSKDKIKKGKGPMSIPMQRTTDILQTMGERKQGHQKLIGFAVETVDPEENARKKLRKKQLDMIVLNNPHVKGAAFEGDTNQVTLITEKDAQPVEMGFKLDIAREILEAVIAGEK